jgi:hypothetical protein
VLKKSFIYASFTMILYHILQRRIAMKKIFDRHKIKEYWQRVYQSTHNKISRGASYISAIIPWARGEYWRKKDEKK